VKIGFKFQTFRHLTPPSPQFF